LLQLYNHQIRVMLNSTSVFETFLRRKKHGLVFEMAPYRTIDLAVIDKCRHFKDITFCDISYKSIDTYHQRIHQHHNI
jgi:hypothetical protein